MAVINAPLVLSRASSATLADSVTGLLTEFGNNIPRFDTGLGLLIEGQRTNGIRNPRAEGAVAGTPGTWPTYWASNGAQGSVVGSSTEGGIPYFEHRFNSGATSTFSAILDTTVAASVGQAWTGSFYTKLVSGSLTNVSFTQIAVAFFNGVGGTGTTLANNVLDITPTSADLWTQRRTGTFTAPAGTLSVQLRFRYVAVGTHDFTLRIGAPQLEQIAFASSPILPPIGTPAAATRLTDNLSAPLSSIGIGVTGACTVVGTFVLPQSLSGQILLCIDDGTTVNRFFIEDVGGGVLSARRFTAGVLAVANTAAITPGTPFRIALSVDGTSRMAASLNGAAIVAVTGGPTSGLTSLRVGNLSNSNFPLNGYAQPTSTLPYPVSDAVLQQLSAL